MSPGAELDTVSVAELEAEVLPAGQGHEIVVSALTADGMRREVLVFRISDTGHVHGTTHARADAVRIGRPA